MSQVAFATKSSHLANAQFLTKRVTLPKPKFFAEQASRSREAGMACVAKEVVPRPMPSICGFACFPWLRQGLGGQCATEREGLRNNERV